MLAAGAGVIHKNNQGEHQPMKVIVTLAAILAVFGGSGFATETTLAPPAAPAGNGLLLEYKFEEGVVDSSGNQRHGKVQGNPQFGEGRVGRCLVLDGAGDYLDCGSAPAELGQTFTVECWVRPDPRQNLHADIFGHHAHGGLGFVMQQDGTNLNRFAVSFGAGAGQWITTRPVQLAGGKWQHVAMVKTPELLMFFRNGVAVASAPVTAPMAVSATTLRVGLGFDGPERCFRGSLDEFRVWNRAIAKFSLVAESPVVALQAGKPAAGDQAAGKWKTHHSYSSTARRAASTSRWPTCPQTSTNNSNRSDTSDECVITSPV